MKFVTSDNVRLDYTDEGTGQPIVLLSGLGSYKEIWNLTKRFLLQNGYRVICLDERNQGSSEHTIHGRRISRHGMDLNELMSHLQIKQFVGVGNSMGAATLFSYVSLVGTAKLAALIDIDQSPKMISDDTWKFGFKGLGWADYPQALKLPLDKANVNPVDDETYELVNKAREAHPYDRELNFPLRVDHTAQDWRDVVQSLDVPFLVMAGENSPYFDAKFAEVTASIAKKGESTVIGNCGHLVMVEQPNEFNQRFLKFLNENS